MSFDTTVQEKSTPSSVTAALIERYCQFATYNEWANQRLYAAAATLSEDQYHADGGAFFGSIHGTLNHLLATDRIWLRRITGEGEAPDRLDAILFDTLPELAVARGVDDKRLISIVEHLTTERLMSDLTYCNMTGARFTQPVWTVLDHLFNHQTHHRGQAHALLTMLGGPDAGPSLDLIALQRETGMARRAAL